MLASAMASKTEAIAINADGQRSWINGHNILIPEQLQKFT
jgi:hypothetical protein